MIAYVIVLKGKFVTYLFFLISSIHYQLIRCKIERGPIHAVNDVQERVGVWLS